MALDTWLAFLVASCLISLSPGAGVVSCLAVGMRHGYRRGIWNILGLQLGILFVLALVATGLGALLAASAVAFALVKWLGVGYLVWLGIAQWRAPAHVPSAGPIDRAASPRELVVRGFLVNATNPKSIVFMLAVLPQFIDATAAQLPQYVVCGVTIFFTDLVVMSAYTLFAARTLRLLRDARHLRVIQRTFGALFVAAAAFLATFRRVA